MFRGRHGGLPLQGFNGLLFAQDPRSIFRAAASLAYECTQVPLVARRFRPPESVIFAAV